jgi:hypothetical protein
METPRVTTPDPPPTHWQGAGTCSCTEPQPKQLAERKGAARTFCAKCGLPTRIAFHH